MRNEPIYMGAGAYRSAIEWCRLSDHAIMHRYHHDYDDVYNNHLCFYPVKVAIRQGGTEMIAEILDLFAACLMPGGAITYGATVAGLLIIALFLGLIDGGYND